MEQDNNNDNLAPKLSEDSDLTAAKQFPNVFSLYSQSWDALKLAFGPLVMLAIRPFVAMLPLIAVFAVQANTAPGDLNNAIFIIIGIISVVAAFIVAIRIAPAGIYVQLQAVRGNKTSARDALEATKHMVVDYFIMSILTGLIIIVGFILLIVPGIFMLKRYILAGYYLVDNNLNATDAMERSALLSKKFSGAHWGLIILQAVILFISYIPILGGIISIIMNIVYYNVNAIRYEQVKAAA